MFTEELLLLNFFNEHSVYGNVEDQRQFLVEG